ncbi:MAG: NAD(P)-dependent oxidoreductase [Candidatus Sulfotelmatobacter sp.]|jgi:GDP-4-dehydro-6-deoxy-D-mannose reductase
MRVLITGGGGFLAGHLFAQLQATADVEVRTLSRAECDLSRDKGRLSAALRSFQPDRIFHLAGRINGSESQLFYDNQVATGNLLQAASRLLPAARIVLGSTTAVYGRGGTAAMPLSEDQRADPRGDYARSKYAAEEDAAVYAQAGVWLVTARMSNPVGANMSSALLCGTLARQIVEIERGKAPILSLRDLTPKRDFISARDCVRALLHLAEFGTPGTTYNVAAGDSIAITEMVNLYLDLARVRPIEVKSRPADEERSSVREQWLSNARLRALGWKPEETLHEAISDQLDAERKRA